MSADAGYFVARFWNDLLIAFFREVLLTIFGGTAIVSSWHDFSLRPAALLRYRHVKAERRANDAGTVENRPSFMVIVQRAHFE